MGKCLVIILLIPTLLPLAWADTDPPDYALVYTDAENHDPSAMEIAISNLGWSVTLVEGDVDTFKSNLDSAPPWDIVAVECYDGDSLSEVVFDLELYLQEGYGVPTMGLKLVLFTSAMEGCSDSELWSTLCVGYGSDISEAFNAYIWNDEGSIFLEPNNLLGPFFVEFDYPVDGGDKHNALSGAVEIAGFTEVYTPGEGVMTYVYQTYDFDNPIHWWGPHLVATINTDYMADQTVAAQLWENALNNIWDCEYGVSVESTSLGEIKAKFK